MEEQIIQNASDAKEQLQQIVQPGESFQQQSFEQAPVQAKYAGFWIRFIANMIDGMAMSILVVLILLLLYKLNKYLGIAVYILSPFLIWAYFIIMTKLYQATLGKRLCGHVVVRSDFSQISWCRIILRETIGKIVSGLIFSIGYIMAGFTEKKQALHDIIADTIVVRRKPTNKIMTWVVVVVFIVILITSGLIGYTILTSMSAMMGGKVKNMQADVKNADTNQNISGFKVPTENNQTSNNAPVNIDKNSLLTDNDYASESYVLSTAAEVNSYFSKNNTYKGYILNEEGFYRLPSGIFTKLDIAPDGKSFVVHRKIEKDQTRSWCIENSMTEVVIANTTLIEKTYHCK